MSKMFTVIMYKVRYIRAKIVILSLVWRYIRSQL